MAGMMIIDIAKRAKAGKGKKESPEYAEDEDEGADEYAEVKASAAADAMTAIDEGDQEGFATALNDFVEACVARKMAQKKG
jgi:hypothetical protein